MRCSRSATHPSRRSARRPRAAALPSPRSPTATTSASSRPATPGRSSAAASACAADAVVDAGGTVLAEHDGVHGFTIGQRKGLGIAGPGPDGRPRYVTAIDADTATVHVGAAADLEVWTLTGEKPVFTSGAAPRGPVECAVQVRAHGGIADAVAEVRDGDLVVDLRAPLPRRGAGPDDGALPPRRRRRRGHRQRHHRAQCLVGHLVHDVRHDDVGNRLGERTERHLGQHDVLDSVVATARTRPSASVACRRRLSTHR